MFIASLWTVYRSFFFLAHVTKRLLWSKTVVVIADGGRADRQSKHTTIDMNTY